ncbi:MAG: hypothetical protein F6K65_31230 [Moorea sp. SIO3C2]|nr:hypothetical protein [Moorena sp. SIO3C2]
MLEKMRCSLAFRPRYGNGTASRLAVGHAKSDRYHFGALVLPMLLAKYLANLPRSPISPHPQPLSQPWERGAN